MLNEIIEEYKETTDEKDKIGYVKEFKDMLWKSKYRFKTYKRYYTYRLNEKSLTHRQDLICLFDKYKTLEFVFCKSYYSGKLSPIDYIRIHVNNMYGFLVNKEVYLAKEYYQLLLVPKREYYETIKKLKNNEQVDYDEIHNRIALALTEAEKIKNASIQKKLDLKWTEYKKLINTYIDRLFDNYIPPHEYEKTHGWEMRVNVDGWNEDNYLIRYFCKSLTGYLMNYVKALQPKEIKNKFCVSCDTEIENTVNNRKYCSPCSKEINKQKTLRNYHKNKIINF